MIWVDSDGVETNPDSSDIILTSVLKQIGQAVNDVVTAASKDQFDSAPYVGTLENGGVDLAPFHDFDSKVPPADSRRSSTSSRRTSSAARSR